MTRWDAAKIAAMRAMANQNASPHERDIARRLLKEQGIPVVEPKREPTLDAFQFSTTASANTAATGTTYMHFEWGTKPRYRPPEEAADLADLARARKQAKDLEREAARLGRAMADAADAAEGKGRAAVEAAEHLRTLMDRAERGAAELQDKIDVMNQRVAAREAQRKARGR